MKIKKPHPKRLVPPPFAIKALIENLSNCTESEIPEIVNACHEWPYPKSDLYNWIPVLNRFDGILETVVERCGVKGIQKRPFTSEEKPVLLAILKLSRLLWDNCNNRNLYNSFEHLTDLLQTTDSDVLDATLKLLLKPAQRVGNQRSLRATFLTAQDRLLTLAQHWATTEHVSLTELASPNFEISEESTSLHYQFYRISLSPQTAQLSSSVSGDAGTSSTAVKDGNGTDGLVSISAPNLPSTGKSEADLYEELKETNHIPQEHHFRLFHKIRVAMGLSDPAMRHKLLILRILAIAVVVNLIGEDVAQTKIFLYEPDLIQKLADLLHSDSERSQTNRSTYELETAALYALDNISRYRGKLGEVLTTVNASATHGILMFIVRRVITKLDSEVMEFPQEYLDSLFNYIAYVITTQSGGNMVITAGIISALTLALEKPPSHHMKNVTRIVGILDSITYGFSNSFNYFANANGLDTLISRIKDEVVLCLEVGGVGKDAMAIDDEYPTGVSDLPHEHTAYLRSMLKFVLHLMQTSGRADRMRNLIDSSVASSILNIFKHAQLFGANVFGLAVNIMSTFIHNEPTCLSILQEAKLPHAFLGAVTSNIPVSTEVISSLPNAFGAICLNQQGLAAFNEAKPMDKFFETFISDEHLLTMQDNDFPHLIGTSIDELIRHHPTLKDDILKSIIAMLNRIVENSLVLSPEGGELCCLQVGQAGEVKTEDEKEKEKADTSRRETKVGGSVDVAARFLEGLFQNVAHCKDFVKMDGTQILIKMVSLPALPFDFVSSDSAYALTYLFRMMIELSTAQVVSVITKELHQVFRASMDLLSTNEESSLFAQYIDLLESDSDRIQRGNHALHTMRTLHIFVRLLTDVYCSHMTPHRIAPAIGQAFTGSLGDELLPMFGQLHRFCVLEQILLKQSVPKAWYQHKKRDKGSEKNSGTANETTGEISAPTENAVSDTEASMPAPHVDEQSTGEDPLDSGDRRIKNTRLYKGLLTDIPSALVTLFEGIIRLLTARRLTDPALKKQTPKIFECIGVVLRDHITWSRINVAEHPIQAQYYAALLGHLSFMLMDDRNQLTLQTFTVAAFHKCDGFTALMKLTKETWEIAGKMDLRSEDGDLAEKEYRAQISTIIEVCVGIFSAVTNDRYLHDAPSTVLINRMERDPNDAPFDPHEFLVEMRSEVLAYTFELLSSPQLSTKTVNIVRTLLTAFGHILKGQGEVGTTRSDALGGGSSSATSAASSALAAAAAAVAASGGRVDFASLFRLGAGTNQPDNERVQMLVDMGFPRGAAEMAFIRTGNVNRAADYLLAHPHELSAFASADATVSAPPPASTSTTSIAGGSTSAGDHSSEAGTGEGSSSSAPTAAEVDQNAMQTGLAVEEDDAAALAEALALSLGAPTTFGMEAATESSQTSLDDLPAVGSSTTTETPAAASTTGLGIELNESKPDKGKGKADDSRKQLDELRRQFKEKFVEIGLKVAYLFDDVGLDVKHMVMMVDKERLMDLVDLVLQDIHYAEAKGGSSMDTDGDNRRLPEPTSIQYRLLALICHDSSLQEKVLSRMKSLLQPMLNAVDKEAKASSPAVWLASMLLVIESFISSVDEPKQVNLIPIPTEVGEGSASGDNVESKNFGQTAEAAKSSHQEDTPVGMELDDQPSGIAMEQRTKLLRDVVLLLEKENLETALVHSLLTVAIRLTRTHTLAVEFARAGGIATLFYSSRIGSFPAQTQFTLILLRHIIEDSIVLQRAMEHEIQSWFKSPRTRSLDMTSFLRSHAHVVCRSESSFVMACENTVVLTKPEASPQKQTLGPKSTDTKEKSASTKDHSSGSTVAAEGTEGAKSDETTVSPVELLRVEYVSEVSESVVSFLVGEILGMRNRDSTVATDKVASQAKDELSRSTETHIRRAFLLQCLSELLASFPTCRVDVINSSGRRGGKTPQTPNKAKNNFLSYVLNSLLPQSVTLAEELRQLQVQSSGSTVPIPANVELDIRKRTLEYMWGASVLTGLCMGVGLDHADEKRLYPELSTVRKIVLESIHRSLKDAVHTSIGHLEPMTGSNAALVEAKYIRYLALADVTNRIITARSTSQIPRPGVRSQAGNEDVSLHIGKVMLEKNFVGLFTTVLGGIEQQHPAAPILIHAVLKPLEWLSKIAIKMGRGVPVPEKKSQEEKESGQSSSIPLADSAVSATSGVIATASAGDANMDTFAHDNIVIVDEPDVQADISTLSAAPDDVVENNIEISEMLRNSALGIFNAHDTEEDEDEEDDSGSEDEDEDGYEEYDDEISDGDEDEEDDQSDVDSDMELVVPGPYHGAAGMADDDMDDEDNEEDEDEEDDDAEVDEDVDMVWGHESQGQDVDVQEMDGERRPVNDGTPGHEAMNDDEYETEEDADDNSDEDNDEIGDPNDDEDDDREDIDDDQPMPLIYEGEIADGEEDDGGFGDRFIPPRFGVGIPAPVNVSRFRRSRVRRLMEMEIGQDVGESPFGTQGGLSLFGVDPLRAPPRTLSNQDLFVHPFLSDATQVGNVLSGRSDRGDRAGRLGGVFSSWRPRVEPPEWPMGDDGLGGSAMLLLDQMIGRRGLSSIHPELSLPGSGGPLDQGGSFFDRTGHLIGTTNGILPNSLGRHPNRPNTAALASLASASVDLDTAQERRLNAVHSFLSVGSVDRWYQEALMLYGNTVLEKATRSTNAILNALIPIALEQKRKQDAQRKAEEQERKAKEEERMRMEEEEKKEADKNGEAKETEIGGSRQVDLNEASSSATQTNDVRMEDASPLTAIETIAMPDASESGAIETPVQAVEVLTNNAAGSGAPTLHESTGAPIIQEPTAPSQETGPSTTQHEERVVVMVNGREVDITGSGIDPTFLEALPDDLRQEVISQHAREQQRLLNQNPAQASISTEFLDALPPEIREEVLAQERISQRAAPVSSSGPVELDPATFIATLDEQLRQTVLLEQDDLMLSNLPPDIIAEANVLRDRVVRTANRYHQRLQHHQHHLSLNVSSAPRPLNAPTKKAHRDGIQLVDKTALMTILKLLFVPEPVSKSSVHRLLLNLCENAKTRMELISLLLSSLSDGTAELGQVDKSFSQMTLKGKGKSAPTTPKKLLPSNMPQPSGGEAIPNLITSRSLEALIHLVQYNEPVAHFFLTESESFSKAVGSVKPANASAPTTPSAKRLSKGKDKAGSSVLSGIGQSKYPVVILMSLLDRPVFLTNTAIMDLLMALLANICKHLPALARKKAGLVANEATTSEIGQLPVTQTVAASGSTTTSPESSQQQMGSESQSGLPDDMNSLALPDASVRSVVNVLTGGECTAKTFQSTLSVLQNLTAVSAHDRDLIMNELIDSAQKLGDSMVPSLEELRVVLGKATSALDVQSVTLAMFAPPSSHQAKLLRVMKAVDFAFSKLPTPKGVSGTEPSGTAATTGPIDSSKPVDALTNNGTKPDSKLLEDPQSALRAAFENLSFNKLWHQLGECLRVVDETPDLINIATVLLPVIESFMVVSKPFVSSAQSVSSTRQIVSQKSIKSFNEMNHEDIFVGFTEEHRKILNTMVRNNPSLMSGSFSLLVRNPKVLEFDNKRTYFTQQLTKRSVREHYGTLQINVRRQHVFEDSFHQLQSRSGNEIKYSKLSVRFYEEEGVDAGGVTREWFTVLARQMFNPDYALFKPSAADRVTYQPNRFSGINPDHLLYFKFVGRIIGKAIYDGRLLDAYFTRSFYKCMLGIAVDWKDMEAIDPEFHKSLEWILNNDITDVLDLTFIAEVDEFGKKRDIDLKPDGRNIAVTEQNKHEYVKLITEYKLTTAIREQIDAFLSGFHEIIPNDLVGIFNEQELELLISGLPDIDIDDWKNNCEYSNYSQSSPQVQWFWRAVRSFTQEERAKLIQFATGTSKVPLEGFSHLQGSNGVQKFQIHKDFSSASRLPSAHTCFNQIDLPQYESYEQLRQNLLTAISECGTGFGFA